MNQIEISTSGLKLEAVVAVARFGAKITISAAAITAMDATRKHIEELANAKEPSALLFCRSLHLSLQGWTSGLTFRVTNNCCGLLCSWRSICRPVS